MPWKTAWSWKVGRLAQAIEKQLVEIQQEALFHLPLHLLYVVMWLPRNIYLMNDQDVPRTTNSLELCNAIWILVASIHCTSSQTCFFPHYDARMEYRIEIGDTLIALVFAYYVFEIFYQKSIYVRNRRDMAVNALLNIPTKIRFLGLIFSLIIPDKWSSRICSKTWVNRCQTSGNTFSAKVQTKHAICTVNTRNLQTFHALNFTHYGVQPLRQPPTLPFLGEGVFTMGGPFW